ncbi:PhnD/SsuA/transferrin family substrate-binding protein [Lysinibacillus fusiformis]|uniref:PhnD/SsuA/transferrin family substrate-binding protein n=1 Tax=Lysinibacillus fusiformis TaxID=28031 RepID=UPI001F4EFE61|nr:PhnD/SsuA/transferrin family substrate-binding protein [Lysinibacillus fusiformis]MCK1988076.1 PhnD/SsuA/transferrin family substrate-binding protein [Lysinibacillus fusiformis]
MKKTLLMSSVLALSIALAACSGQTTESKVDDKIDIVWYPNESGSDLKASRDEIGALIEEATGKEVKHHLTTDYAIAIETIANGNADMGFMGSNSYIEAKKKNDAVIPLAVQSGASGTLDDAIYYSWLAVDVNEQVAFKKDNEFSLDTIEGKSISFVSNSSTSGFKVPSSTIIKHFSEMDKYADLSEESIMTGAELFEQVLFGNSHQGSAVNLLNGDVDVAAFCDTCVEEYVELKDGEANRQGAIYTVKENAAEPFNKVAGKDFTLMNVTPVLNEPFVANLETMGQEDFDTIQALFTSDEFANNEMIFGLEGSETATLFTKEDNERFLKVEDAWFNPIRELTK